MRSRRLTVAILILLATVFAFQQSTAAEDVTAKGAAAEGTIATDDHDDSANNNSESPWLPFGIGAGGIAIVGLVFLSSR